MKLTKAQRTTLHGMFGGRCAYCGEVLGARWHADHVKSVQREMTFKGGKFVATGKLHRPENDAIDNMMPACPPCNIDKNTMTLEDWRGVLARGPDVLHRNYPTYRHAKRFGLVAETNAPIVFHFEREAA